jgi:head-tail adaptor
MPRFYFDVREGARFIPDDEGLEFDSFEAAEREAAETAAEIGRDRLPTGDTREITIEMRNEHRQRVLTVKVLMDIDRVEPPPQPPRW